MKKTKLFLILLALLAFGPVAWAQTATPSTALELVIDDSDQLYYKFNYPTTSATGEPVVLSSLLSCWAPENPQEGDSIEAVHINCHYTITADSQCPTQITHGSTDYLILGQLTNGYSSALDPPFKRVVTHSIVIMPDYEGYGVSSDRTHPYLAEAATAQQVVDAVTYGLELYNNLNGANHTLPLKSNWRSFSIGYSQGGSVALAVQRHIEQNYLSNQLHFRGTLCGDGPYDLIATLRYYMEDNGTSYGVTTDHRAGQATLPMVIPMIIKGMIDSYPGMDSHTLGDYLTESFLATGIMDWLGSKTMTNDNIIQAWREQLNNGSTIVNGTTYTAPANMSEMFFEKQVPGMLWGTQTVVWANLDKVFTSGFYNYLTTTSNFNSVPAMTGNAYQDMHHALDANNVCTGWEPKHRIQFAHSKGDMVVPYGNYLAFCNAHPNGQNDMYRVDDTYSSTDHQNSGTSFMLKLDDDFVNYFEWLDESPLEWDGNGTEDDPYQICSADDWQLLCDRVNGEVSYYTGKYFKLMADITIEETFSSRPTKQVGHGENVNFRGIFDGNGHTMTINYVDNNDEDYCAPFRYIRNATIKNLHVAGSITKTDNRKAGGLVGVAFGTCHINNCRSSVDIFFDDSGDCSSGGFIGELGESSSADDTYFENCLFDGKLRGTSAYSWGGFIGWVKDEPDVYFTNCLFNPTEVSIGTDGSKTFARTDNSGDVHVSNIYYKYLINNAQGGIDASSMDNENLRIALGDGWEIVTEDGVDKVVPIMGPRTLTGNGTAESPYLIANTGDWHALATNVQFGETYNGKYFQMANNISVGRMVGTSEANSFQGIFDGDGHTLTFNYTISENYCAPFRYADGATFQNLKIMGTINTSNQYAAGFVGYVTGSGCTFTNCESNITINASAEGDGTHGGFVANIAAGSTVFNGCAFTGSMLGTSTHSSAGFVGWTDGRFSDGSAAFTNCFYRPTSNTMDTYSGATFARGWDLYIDTYYTNPDNITLSNCYYAETFGLAQGKQAYSITAGENANFTMAFAGEATEYNVSGISIFGTSLQYGDVLYAGNGDNVSLGLTAPAGYVIVSATYTPEGGTATEMVPIGGVYPFTMPDANVTINATLAHSITQTVVLEAGQTWWSTNLAITLDDLKNAIAVGLGNIGTATIKSQAGTIVYNKGNWRGDGITTLDIKQMYKIWVSVDSEITLTGVPVDPSEYEITIVYGNNEIGFLPGSSMSVTDAFAGLNPENGDVIKSLRGTTTYNGARWRGTLTTLEPGEGYIYQSKAAGNKTFTYPAR